MRAVGGALRPAVCGPRRCMKRWTLIDLDRNSSRNERFKERQTVGLLDGSKNACNPDQSVYCVVRVKETATCSPGKKPDCTATDWLAATRWLLRLS